MKDKKVRLIFVQSFSYMEKKSCSLAGLVVSGRLLPSMKPRKQLRLQTMSQLSLWILTGLLIYFHSSLLLFPFVDSSDVKFLCSPVSAALAVGTHLRAELIKSLTLWGCMRAMTAAYEANAIPIVIPVNPLVPVLNMSLIAHIDLVTRQCLAPFNRKKNSARTHCAEC